MKRLLAILLLFASFVVQSASIYDYIRGNLTVTNGSLTNDFWTVNGTTRYGGTNRTSTQWTTNGSPAITATNIFSQLGSWPLTGVRVTMTSPTNIEFAGVALTAATTNHLGFFTLTTNAVGTNRWVFMGPIETFPITQRITNGNEFVAGLNYATTNVATNAAAFSNYLSLGPQPQTVSNKDANAWTIRNPAVVTNAPITNSTFGAGTLSGRIANSGTIVGGSTTNVTHTNDTFGGGTFSGRISNAGIVTGGGYSNATVDGLTATNANFPGSGTDSQKIGSGSVASGTHALALGVNAIATNTDAVAIGTGALSYRNNGIAIGGGALIDEFGLQGIAIGIESGATSTNSIAIGTSASSTHQNSIVLGNSVSSSDDNEVVLGGSSHHVNIAGEIRGVRLTNEVHRGTNVFNSRVDFTSRANAGLVNGANAGIVLGSNVYVRLSGATTVAGISGFVAEQDGSFHIVQFTGAITNVIVNEANSTDIATDGTVANRIVTGTGTNFYATNTPLVIPFVYDATAARWRMMNFLR